MNEDKKLEIPVLSKRLGKIVNKALVEDESQRIDDFYHIIDNHIENVANYAKSHNETIQEIAHLIQRKIITGLVSYLADLTTSAKI